MASKHYEILEANFDRLLNAITPVVAEVARKSLPKKLISLANLRYAENLNQPEDHRASTLLIQILGKVEEKSSHYDAFMSVLESIPVLEDIAVELITSAKKSLNQSRHVSLTSEPALVTPASIASHESHEIPHDQLELLSIAESNEANGQRSLITEEQPARISLEVQQVDHEPCETHHAESECHTSSVSSKLSLSPTSCCPSCKSALRTAEQNQFPYLDMERLDAASRVNLQAKLISDTEEMIDKWTSLVSQTEKSLEENNVHPKKVATIVYNHCRPFRKKYSQLAAEDVKTIPDIIFAINPYMSFFNHEILHQIIKIHGTKEDKQRFDQYLSEFHLFCKRSVFEVPPTVYSQAPDNPENRKMFAVKLEDADITLNQTMSVRQKIAKIIGLDTASLYLCHIDEGCVKLTFMIPAFVVDELFPLNETKLAALLDIGISQIDDPLTGNVQPIPKHTSVAYTAPNLSTGHGLKEILTNDCNDLTPQVHGELKLIPTTVTSKDEQENSKNQKLKTKVGSVDQKSKLKRPRRPVGKHPGSKKTSFHVPLIQSQSIDDMSNSSQISTLSKTKQTKTKPVHPVIQTKLHELDSTYLMLGEDTFYYENRDYFIDESVLLGQGRSSFCFLARDEKTSVEFVIKQPKTKGQKAINSIVAECQILSRLLYNDHVVCFLGAVMDTFQVSNTFTRRFECKMMLELAEYGNLSEILVDEYGDPSPLPLDQSLFYLEQILKGVEFLHNSGVLHLGIEGQNILLFDSGRKAKLAGFGTSVHIGDATFSTKIMRNSPPEVVNREKPDFSADVWGVMCVFVDMLTAKKYQLYNNRLALIGNYEDSRIEELVPLSEMGLELDIEDVVRDGLRKNPRERPQASELLNHPRISTAFKYGIHFDVQVQQLDPKIPEEKDHHHSIATNLHSKTSLNASNVKGSEMESRTRIANDSKIKPRLPVHFSRVANLSAMLVDENGDPAPLPLDQSLFYLQQILEGVGFLHSIGVLHLDIKGPNIFVFDGGRRVKLADFGTAVHSNDINSESVGKDLKGCTLYYAAPEIIRQEVPGFSADIWGVMCVFVEMLTGALPGCAKSQRSHPAMMYLVANYDDSQIEDIVPLSEMGLEPDIEELFKSVFRKKPENRPTALELLDHPRISTAGEYEAYFDECYEKEDQLEADMNHPQEQVETMKETSFSSDTSLTAPATVDNTRDTQMVATTSQICHGVDTRQDNAFYDDCQVASCNIHTPRLNFLSLPALNSVTFEDVPKVQRSFSMGSISKSGSGSNPPKHKRKRPSCITRPQRLMHSNSAPVIRRHSLQLNPTGYFETEVGEMRPRLRRTSSEVYVDKGPDIDSPERVKKMLEEKSRQTDIADLLAGFHLNTYLIGQSLSQPVDYGFEVQRSKDIESSNSSSSKDSDSLASRQGNALSNIL